MGREQRNRRNQYDTTTSSTTAVPTSAAVSDDVAAASSGDLAALDSYFSRSASTAWAVAFATAGDITLAATALSDAYVSVLSDVRIGTASRGLLPETRRHARAASGISSVVATQNRQLPAANSGRHSRSTHAFAPEPISSRDVAATLAVLALAPDERLALWLHVTAKITEPELASLVDIPAGHVGALLAQAKNRFCEAYVTTSATGSGYACAPTLARVAPYVVGELSASAAEGLIDHLRRCQRCEALVALLRDIESRLIAAIPPLPAWSRQQIVDRWNTLIAKQPAVPAVVASSPIDARQSLPVSDNRSVSTSAPSTSTSAPSTSAPKAVISETVSEATVSAGHGWWVKGSGGTGGLRPATLGGLIAAAIFGTAAVWGVNTVTSADPDHKNDQNAALAARTANASGTTTTTTTTTTAPPPATGNGEVTPTEADTPASEPPSPVSSESGSEGGSSQSEGAGSTEPTNSSRTVTRRTTTYVVQPTTPPSTPEATAPETPVTPTTPATSEGQPTAAGTTTITSTTTTTTIPPMISGANTDKHHGWWQS